MKIFWNNHVGAFTGASVYGIRGWMQIVVGTVVVTAIPKSRRFLTLHVGT